MRPDTTATVVERGQLGDGVEHAGQQLGLVGVGDDRGEHTVDVEPDQQRPREAGGGRRHGGRIVERLGHSGLRRREVDEEPLGPALHVAAADDLAQPAMRVRRSWRCISTAVTIASRRAALSWGLTSTASVSSSAAPANSDSTSTPSPSSRVVTYSLATRFMPSRSGVTSITSPVRYSATSSSSGSDW